MDIHNSMLSDVYEGNEPYLFISYSHKDQQAMLSVKNILKESNVRFWYDNGLHSGDDWNMVIAKHLKQAAVCLLILSSNSAESEYVKNELNFAMNHRIPIHTVLLKQFDIPLDVDMMTGRIQKVEMTGDYQKKILKSLPTEVYSHDNDEEQSNDKIEHPLFEIKTQISNRQGTRIYTGIHKRLGYNCLVMDDIVKSDELHDAEKLVCLVSRLSHIAFPTISDYTLKGLHFLTYQEYFDYMFLDEYLTKNQLEEDTIIRWITVVIEGLSYLYSRNLVFRDFARGSLIVTKDQKIKILRLHNTYYGLIEVREETKRYYFEKEIQEVAILLAQLCLGEEPLLPLRIVAVQRFSKHFLQRINLIIQKCVKENGRTQYNNFNEILQDIQKKLSFKEKWFLCRRSEKLNEYEKARSERSNQFFSNDINNTLYQKHNNLEEEFGFEGTVILQENTDDRMPSIRIRMCSTGQIVNFDKREITIGKDIKCDMRWTQPYISRIHLKVELKDDENYIVTDLNSANGTFVVCANDNITTGSKRINPSTPVTIKKGTYIKVGFSEIQLL